LAGFCVVDIIYQNFWKLIFRCFEKFLAKFNFWV